MKKGEGQGESGSIWTSTWDVHPRIIDHPAPTRVVVQRFSDGATRHPHGATDRQDDGAGWESSTTKGLIACARRRVEMCQARGRFRRRSRGVGLVTGAAGGGPSFSMLGLRRGRYDSPSMTKS